MSDPTKPDPTKPDTAPQPRPAPPAGKASYPDRLLALAAEVEGALSRLLPAADTSPTELMEAMRYSALAGGKRVRPALACLFSEAVAGTYTGALPVGCAFECVHVYSLIHDDLPAMDDDDLRRGKPASHKVYGEALAILAGDGLLTFAFELVASFPDPARAVRLTLELARAAGARGMVGGQVLDLRGEGRTQVAPESTEAMLEAIHRAKTAALIRGACVAGAIAGGASADVIEAARTYGEAIGLCFQVSDDILDVTQSSTVLGKTAGKDAAQGKLTYPALLGLEGARARAAALADAAKRALEALPASAARDGLAQLADFIRDRDR